MIPATYPSILDSSNRTKMLVYQVPSIVGLTRWIDYIPVKSPTSESDLSLANTYANEGFILTSKVNDITGLVPFKDYVPIYLDSTATKAWSADNDGYIPMAELAGLLLDFTTGTLDPRIAFTRATNATVTNSAGLITYAPHNLLTYSEQFDNAVWTPIESSVSANSVIAPNESKTADLLTASTANTSHYVINSAAGISVSLTAYTLSFYAKANTVSQVGGQFKHTDAGQGRASFNLATGVATAILGTNVSASMLPVGNGWYRCVLTATFTITTGSPSIFVLNSSGSFAFAGAGESVYLWGAQLEIGSTATTYNPTTVKNLLGYSELFDNAAWTKSNSFVQTNLLTYSEAFDNAAWVKTNATITANSTLAPDGTTTADAIFETATSGIHRVTQNATTLPGVKYTVSAYVKPNGRTWIIFVAGSAGNGYYFDLQNLAVGSETGGSGVVSNPTITQANNGFVRVSFNVVPVDTSRGAEIFTSTGNGNFSFAGDITKGVYVWGAQLVQGSVAGDYRRTDATALPVYYPNHNGVVCAEKLVENATTNPHATFGNFVSFVTGQVFTWSVYAKAAERQILQFVLPSGFGGIGFANFNLSTGQIGSSNIGTPAINSLGNGWYRCSVTATATATVTQQATINIVTSSTSARNESYTGDGTSGIYIFGAQLSDSASLDPYVLNAAAAPTAAAYYGPRFDYDPVTLAPEGLLIEEQRSNLSTYSEQFNNAAAWNAANVTFVTNALVSPSGASNGTKLVETTSTTVHGVYATTTFSAGAYTLSLYVKAAERSKISLSFSNTAFPTSTAAIFNLSTLAITTSNSTGVITPVGNGWYRCAITATALAAFGVYEIRIESTGSYTGDGTSGIYVWGAQLEAGAFATSYIPTVASQVTKAADVATIQGSNFYSWYNRGEGTINSTYLYAAQISGNTSKVVAFDPIAVGSYATIASAGGAQTGWFASGLNIPTANSNVINKQAIAYNSWGDFSGALNNVLATPSTTSDYTGASTALYLGQRSNGQYMNGTIKQISYYPQRLSNDVLKGLTA